MIKPVGDLCNLRCTYCYYRGASPRGALQRVLSTERLDKMLAQWLGKGPEQISISFQGGEPTLAGKEWFERFFARVDRYRRGDQKISFGLQTNGLQFDQDRASLLKSREVLVGLSIDGPQELHDYYRVDTAGRGTFSRVQQVAKLLLSENIKVNAIVLLNDRNVADARRLYGFLKGQGFEWLQFIPCVEWNQQGQVEPFCVTPETYGKFLLDLFEAWYPQDVGKVFERYFESLLVKLAQAGSGVCYMESYCNPGLTIEHDGSVYGCDHFVTEPWRLGCIDDSGIIHWDTHPRYLQFGRQKADLPRQCIGCAYLNLCGGGCLKHRRTQSRQNVLCTAYKHFFDVNLGRLKRLVRRLT